MRNRAERIRGWGIVLGLLLAGCGGAGTELATRAPTAPDLGPVPLAGELRGGPSCVIPVPAAPALPLFVDLPDAYLGNERAAVSDAIDAWKDRVMALGSNARVSAASAQKLRATLLEAAGAGALAWPAGWDQGSDRPPSVVFHTMAAIFPAIVAYDQNKSVFEPAERALFEAWAGGIVDRLGRAEIVREWRLDNKKYQYGAILAAYGHTTGNAALMARSQSIYRGAIGGMRGDGSLPTDSERGGSALHYSNAAIANLVAIAEFNAAVGVDLYSERRGGRDLHLAVDFLTRATRTPALISGYADAPGWEQGSMRPYTPNNPDIRWAGNQNALWGYYYLRRFGARPEAEALRAISPFLREGRAGTQTQAGGNARCFTAEG